MLPLSGITQILTSCLIHILILSYITVTRHAVCLFLVICRIIHTQPTDCKFLDGIQVYIGSETQGQSMKDCSIVTANYELGDGLRGTIGIVGPKRMDYDKVVSTLRSLKSQLDQTFNHKDTE